ncbi:MAG: methyltransferase, partial [Polyangiaceae bacterium]
LPHEVAPERVEDLGKDLVRQCAHLEPHVELLRACFAKYPDVLIGKVDPVAVMFPRGSMQLVEGIFAGNPIVDHYNDIVARAVRAFVRSRPSDGQPLRVVEVGAGTGATSSRVLPTLAALELPLEYVYTDISQHFISHGKQAYGERYPFVRFEALNLESDARVPEADLVLGTNVVHATRSIERTLRKMQGALRPGGVVVLNELMGRTDFSTLTFGLTPGWWLYEDDFRRIPGSPLLSLESWTAVLSEIGLSSNEVLDPDGSPPPTYSRVIVASARV